MYTTIPCSISTDLSHGSNTVWRSHRLQRLKATSSDENCLQIVTIKLYLPVLVMDSHCERVLIVHCLRVEDQYRIILVFIIALLGYFKVLSIREDAG